MKVYFYNLAKRVNSTKQPTGTGQAFDCVLKENTSIVSPTLKISTNSMASVPAWNYAYIPDFRRYYHITDVSSDGWMWYISMAVDVLATYKSAIGAENLYMLRSTHSYDGSIIDTFYPVKADYDVVINRDETPWPHWDLETPGVPNWQIKVRDGVFIIGVLAVPETGGSGSYGSIKYLALSQAAMKQLIDKLMGNTIWNSTDIDIDGATMSVTKSLLNPLSYIKVCMWAPCAYDSLPGIEVTSIKIWEWTLNLNANTACKLLSSYPSFYNMKRLTLSKHPSAATRGSYLNTSPYSTYTLFYPPYGIIQLDTVDLIKTNAIQLESTVDLITGEGRLDIYTTAGSGGSLTRHKLINRIKSQVCVPIQLAEVGYDYSNVGMTALGAGSQWLGNWLGGFASAVDSGLAGAVSRIGDLANTQRQKVSTVGSSGNFCDLDGYLELIQEFYKITAEDFGHVGRPLCIITKASTGNSGDYWLAREGDIALSGATFEERSAVKNFLEGGFFWE